MRMVPPASMVPWRECETTGVFVGNSDECGRKQEIPVGTNIGVSPYTVFRRADVFPEPMHFWPERWLSEGEGGSLGEQTDSRARGMQTVFFWST